MNLSIIIVNYNTEKLLKNCLKSIVQSIGPNAKGQMLKTEIIVVDNNSSDGSRGYLERLTTNSLKLKAIFNKENLGFAKAVNQGIKKSQGNYILLLNTDTQVKPGDIEYLVNFAKKSRKIGLVAPRLLNSDGTIQPSCFKLPTVIGAVKRFWLGDKGAFGKYAPKTSKPVEVEAAVAAVWLIPRSTIDRIGLFNEKYFLYYEDIDYCRRLKQAGLKVYYLPQVEITHLHGASGKKLGEKTTQWLVESSKKYHGLFKYYLITAIIKLGINE